MTTTPTTVLPSSRGSAPGASTSTADPAARGASWTSRVLGLACGSLVYVVFLVTFLYAIGFVSDLWVPKSVSGGAPAPLAEALLVNGGLLALFALQHTVMARKAFKQRWTRIVPAHLERSTFVLAASLILGVLFWQWRHLPGTLWELGGPAAWLLRGASFLGWGIVLLGSFLIDHFELFGLRQVARHFRKQPIEAPQFRERWLYRRVRHPLMLGFLLAFWSTPVMSTGHLFFTLLCTGYILAGIRIEERSLVAEHGETYRDYCRRVPMLLPLPVLLPRRRRSS